METCGSCKYWDTWGFGERKNTGLGKCNLVSRSWYPPKLDKMISLIANEYSRAPALTGVVTRREFGCNQWAKNDKS